MSSPNVDGSGDSFDINDWFDAYEPAREELEPDYSSLAREAP